MAVSFAPELELGNEANGEGDEDEEGEGEGELRSDVYSRVMNRIR